MAIRGTGTISVFAAAILANPAFAGNGAHFIFDRSSGEPNAVAVDGSASFDRAKGYGFEPAGAVVDADAHCTRPASPTADPIVAPDTTARFSVALPEGSYRVRLEFSSAIKGAIAAETRRFFYLPPTDHTPTEHAVSFLVDLRSPILPALPLNAPGGVEVRRNARECGSYSWDDKLTLAFDGDQKNLTRIDIDPVTVPRLFLLGDSTVADQPQPPYAGWGQMLPWFFGPGIVVANHAESGETLKSFLAELRLDKILSQAKPGDWALIQFSHNDEKAQWPQTHEPAGSTFPLYLKVYIAELRRRGVEPILVTPMQRLRFDANGKIIDTHGAYPAAIRKVATEENVALVDLTTMSTKLFEALGPQAAREAFAGHGADATHQSSYGAFELARCVVEALHQQHVRLAQLLKPEPGPFDPAKPDDAAKLFP